MIDIHAHILPDMDDGARSWEEAAEMAETAAESGTHTLAATVHANLPGMDNHGRLELYARKLERFQRLLRQEQIPLTVCSGMEVFADASFPKDFCPGDFLTLNGSPYLLVEFSMDESAAQIYRVLDGLLERGCLPVIAHPERYECVQAVPAHVYEWYQMGAVIQLNKGSLLGRFGSRIRRTAESLLRHRLVMAVASDAHRADIRTTDLSGAAEILREEYGRETAYLLLEENPGRILQGRALVRQEAVPYNYAQSL